MLNSQSGWHQEAASKGASPHEHNRSSPRVEEPAPAGTGGGEVGGDTDRSNPPPLFPLPPREGKRDIAGSVELLWVLHQRWRV